MSLPARPQTFAIENCRDVHSKLEWEIDSLKACPVDQGPEPMIYHAFNCAVTAWTLTDWVWQDMSPAQQSQWGGGKSGLVAFQSWCRAQCRALHLCRQVATASKHAAVTAHPDPAVVTTVSADVQDFRADAPCDQPLAEWVWMLTIHDGSRACSALQVYEEALGFWDHFIVGNGIPPEPRP